MAQTSPTALISADEVAIDYGQHLVLDHASLAIHEGERVGMVGRNGSGKTTFLKILAGELKPDSGEVVRRRDLVTGYLPQNFLLDEAGTVHANIISGVQHILDLIYRYEHENDSGEQHHLLFEKIDHFEGWTIDHRIKSLMDHLNAPAPERIVKTLSGGEKRRVALCRALLARPDFLILDEPTNHLDTESIEWLEDFLVHYPGACLFVTHDRYFLDRIANRIVELSNGNFYSHSGTYTDFLEAKANRQAVEEQQEASRQTFLKRELEWVRRQPRAQRAKAKDRVERYHTEAAKDRPEVEMDVDLVIPPAPRLADRVIELTKVGMELGGKSLFQKLTLNLKEGARIGIVGRNGLGKTTLLKVMMGEIPPVSGKVQMGLHTKINYVDQARVLLNDQKTILEELGDNGDYVQIGDKSISLRNYLKRFLFSEDRINTKISTLSGGERSRAILAKILKRGGNVIILDEPTNDLDLATLRLLEEALIAFKGTIIAVSHDRFFLNRICTEVLGFEGDGQLFHTLGNYDDYLAKRPAKSAGSSITEPEASARSQPPAQRPRKLKWKEEKELSTIEADIQAAEAEAKRIETLFADPEFYKKHGADWEKLEAQLAESKAKAKSLYQRWEELEKIKAAISS